MFGGWIDDAETTRAWGRQHDGPRDRDGRDHAIGTGRQRLNRLAAPRSP